MARTMTFLALLSAATLAGGVAAAKGDGDGGRTERPKAVSPCPSGAIHNPASGACERLVSTKMTRAQLKDEGRALALRGQYDRALDVLRVADQTDPIVLTYIGYALRKSGDFERGVAYYERALAIAPNSKLTLHYMGVGYAKSGDKAAARRTLERLIDVCGDCEEVVTLSRAIAGDARYVY